MESVGDVIKRQTSRFQYQDLVQQISFFVGMRTI